MFVMLRFSSDALPGGQSVLPVYTLPLSVQTATASREVSPADCEDERSADIILAENLIGIAEGILAQGIRSKAITAVAPIKEGQTGEIGCSGTDDSVFVLECPGSLGIGGKVWDATFSLLEYLNVYPETVRNKIIIELGSGTGLAGTLNSLLLCCDVD